MSERHQKDYPTTAPKKLRERALLICNKEQYKRPYRDVLAQLIAADRQEKANRWKLTRRISKSTIGIDGEQLPYFYTPPTKVNTIPDTNPAEEARQLKLKARRQQWNSSTHNKEGYIAGVTAMNGKLLLSCTLGCPDKPGGLFQPGRRQKLGRTSDPTLPSLT